MPDDKQGGGQFCSNCGLQKVKPSAPGSITGYMFDPVRCKCTAEGDGAPTLKPMSAGNRTFAAIGDTANPDLHLEEGALVGGSYAILGRIGHGGMGVVYQARHVTLGKRCAVKLMPPDEVTSTAWSRFQLEAKSVAKFDHKNIVKVTDLGLHKGYMPFYAMEYIKGQSLAERLASHGPLELHEALAIFIQICDGVDYAHRAGVIHRDLKPANIMLGEDGVVKILDFGLAKLAHQNRAEQSLTSVGDVFGSPYYMSPEQSAGEKVDNRSDIYSLGCALFECLTGRPPFEGNLAAAIMFAQQESRPPTLESILGKNKVPEAMEIILAKLLRKNPVERYQTCRELGLDLRRVNEGKSVEPVYVSRAAVKPVESTVQEPDPKQSPLPKILIAIAASVVVVGMAALYLNQKIGAAAPARPDYPDTLQSVVSVRPDAYADADAVAVAIADVDSALTSHAHLIKKAPASAAATEFYSTAESADKAIKTFKFPTDVRIGTLNNGLTSDIVAVGEVIVDARNLKFWPSPVCVSFPQYLSRFRPGELQRLMFSTENVTLAFENSSEDFEDINSCCHALTFLSDWENLPKLGFWHLSHKLTPESTRILSSLNALRVLDLGGRDCDCESIAKMPFMKTLTGLNVAELANYPALFEGLRHSTNFTSLSIDRGDFSEQELEALSDMPNLQQLFIDSSTLTAAQLTQLARLKSVKSLTLMYKSVPNFAALRTLRSMPSLRRLRITAVPRSGLGALAAIRQALPGIAIEFESSKD